MAGAMTGRFHSDVHQGVAGGYYSRTLADSVENSGKSMEQTIFMICMFFGVAAVALIAFTLLMIVLGRVDV